MRLDMRVLSLRLRVGALLAAVVPASLLVSCAGVTHRPLPNGDPSAEQEARGIRYYQSSLYLLVYSDGQGGLVSRIIELPDPTKKMVAEPYSVLSRIDLRLKFENGVLRNSAESPDATPLPRAVLEAVEGVVRTATARISRQAAARGAEASFPAPYIYKIVTDGDGIRFIGGQGDAPVRVTLRPRTGSV